MKGGITVPFYIPASVAGVGAIASVTNPGVDARCKVALHVVSGGPVFMWFGRVELKEAYRKSHDPASIDFDFAASANGTYESIVTRAGLEVITLQSDSETIGFIELMPCAD